MLINKQDGTKPRQFYASSLRKVADDETDYKNMTMQKASGAELTSLPWGFCDDRKIWHVIFVSIV